MMDMPTGVGIGAPLPGTEAAMEADFETFEILTTGGARWLVKARDHRVLDGDIDRGVILDARVRAGLGDTGWRVNAAQIVAYRPENDA